MQMVRLQVENIMGTLSDKEREAARLRYGLQDGKQRSFREVAEELGVSKSTAMRRTSSAISKLKDPERAQRLKDYLQE